MTNDKKDKLLLDLGTFGSVSNLPAHFHVDTVNVTLRPHSDDVRPTIHHTFLECNDRSMCYSAQEDEELDDLWSLLREDIIEIKGKSTFLRRRKRGTLAKMFQMTAPERS